MERWDHCRVLNRVWIFTFITCLSRQNGNTTKTSTTVHVRWMTDTWCVQGMFKIYRNGITHNDKGKYTWAITKEPCILTSSLAAVPEIQDLFARHRCEWKAARLRKYNATMVREFYTLYAAIMTNTKQRA